MEKIRCLVLQTVVIFELINFDLTKIELSTLSTSLQQVLLVKHLSNHFWCVILTLEMKK